MAAGRPAENSELVLHRYNVHVAGVQEVGGAPVRLQVLLFNLEADGVRIPVAPPDVIDRHRKAMAFGMPRGHRPKQVGCKRGDAAFARQVVAEKCDGSTAGKCFHDLALSRRINETLAKGFGSLLPVPIGSFLALDTALRPWQGCEASWADCRFALGAKSKAAAVHTPQCSFYLTHQVGLAVHVSNRQFPLRCELNLVHLVRALLDGDAVPAP